MDMAFLSTGKLCVQSFFREGRFRRNYLRNSPEMSVFLPEKTKMEIISLEGLRNDGRRQNELRKMSAKLRMVPDATGSAFFESGNTKLLVAVYGPTGNLSQQAAGKTKVTEEEACIHCEVVVAEFSSSERKDPSKNERAANEVACAVEQTFDNVVMTHLYPESQIDILIEVLEADGSLVAAAINATTLALIDAGLPMKDFVCACSASLVDDEPMVDLNRVEEVLCGPVLTLGLMPKKRNQAMLEMSARFHFENVERTLRAAEDGCARIHKFMIETVSKLIEYVGTRIRPE